MLPSPHANANSKADEVGEPTQAISDMLSGVGNVECIFIPTGCVWYPLASRRHDERGFDSRDVDVAAADEDLRVVNLYTIPFPFPITPKFSDAPHARRSC